MIGGQQKAQVDMTPADVAIHMILCEKLRERNQDCSLGDLHPEARLMAQIKFSACVRGDTEAQNQIFSTLLGMK